MKLKRPGESTSVPEVTIISAQGFWLYVNQREYFLSYKEFPWFKNATINEIFEVQILHQTHLYWKNLDIDLELDSLENPEKYPLIYK
jgi:hypothetical protein